MSNKWVFDRNDAGVAEILKGAEMQKLVNEVTARILAAAQEENPGYASEVKVARHRVAGTVWADTPHARNSNIAHNTLLKALRRGGSV